MKKTALIILFVFLTVGTILAQSNGNAISGLDTAVKGLAVDLNRRLIDEKARTIELGQFVYMDSLPPLSTYWTNQLNEELTNTQGKSYSILSGGAELLISGEIIEISNIVRIYTRLIRLSDSSITASFHSDIERNEHIIGMLYSEDNSRRGSVLPRDAWESDSFENPVSYEISSNERVMNRNIHNGSDEDFFLLTPFHAGSLVAETTGNVDTYIEFYDADTMEMLSEDDDGGSGYNAQMRYNVEAGKRYIVKVRGYSSGDTGNYGFRAYMILE